MNNRELDKKLSLRKIKPTAVRELVLKVLTEEKKAVSLSDLEHKFDYADKSTLYRTLKTFEEKKLIHSIDDGSGTIKYAVCHDSCECNPNDLHVHFYCTRCKQTFCLNEVSIPTVNLPVGFSLESVTMVVKGVCSNCRKG